MDNKDKIYLLKPEKEELELRTRKLKEEVLEYNNLKKELESKELKLREFAIENYKRSPIENDEEYNLNIDRYIEELKMSTLSYKRIRAKEKENRTKSTQLKTVELTKIKLFEFNKIDLKVFTQWTDLCQKYNINMNQLVDILEGITHLRKGSSSFYKHINSDVLAKGIFLYLQKYNNIGLNKYGKDD